MRRVRLLFVVGLVFIPRTASPQGNPAGSEFRVNTHTPDSQSRPAVAAASSGGFVVVWTSNFQDGAGEGVFGQRYAPSGAAVGPEFPVNTYTAAAQNQPSVAADATGNFVVVWQSYGQDGASFGIFGRRYASSGAPLGTEFRVNTYTTGSQALSSVAAASSGDFVVVWSSYGQEGYNLGWGIFGQRYASTGTPLGPEFRVNTHTTNWQATPSVAADSSGNFVVVWRGDYQVSGLDVFGQRYASTGAPLGPEFPVNTFAGYYQDDPAVAADSSGNFVVVWRSYQSIPAVSFDVSGQRYAASGAPVGPEFRVNTYAPTAQTEPSVAADASGNFAVVWTSQGQDGSSGGVFGQRYDSSGTPLGPEFRVNTFTTGSQGGGTGRGPAVASDSSGNFVVVWPSQDQDGSSNGIFGQRYDMIVPVELMRFQVE